MLRSDFPKRIKMTSASLHASESLPDAQSLLSEQLCLCGCNSSLYHCTRPNRPSSCLGDLFVQEERNTWYLSHLLIQLNPKLDRFQHSNLLPKCLKSPYEPDSPNWTLTRSILRSYGSTSTSGPLATCMFSPSPGRVTPTTASARPEAGSPGIGDACTLGAVIKSKDFPARKPQSRAGCIERLNQRNRSRNSSKICTHPIKIRSQSTRSRGLLLYQLDVSTRMARVAKRRRA